MFAGAVVVGATAIAGAVAAATANKLKYFFNKFIFRCECFCSHSLAFSAHIHIAHSHFIHLRSFGAVFLNASYSLRNSSPNKCMKNEMKFNFSLKIFNGLHPHECQTLMARVSSWCRRQETAIEFFRPL